MKCEIQDCTNPVTLGKRRCNAHANCCRAYGCISAPVFGTNFCAPHTKGDPLQQRLIKYPGSVRSLRYDDHGLKSLSEAFEQALQLAQRLADNGTLCELTFGTANLQSAQTNFRKIAKAIEYVLHELDLPTVEFSSVRIDLWARLFGRSACAQKSSGVLLLSGETPSVPTLIHEYSHIAVGTTDLVQIGQSGFCAMLGTKRLKNAYHYEAAAGALMQALPTNEITRCMGNPDGVRTISGQIVSASPPDEATQLAVSVILSARKYIEDMLALAVDYARVGRSPESKRDLLLPVLPPAVRNHGWLITDQDLKALRKQQRETMVFHEWTKRITSKHKFWKCPLIVSLEGTCVKFFGIWREEDTAERLAPHILRVLLQSGRQGTLTLLSL